MGVQPIRSKEKIEQMKKWLMRKNYRDYALFYTGLNSGLRISDILELRVLDVRGKDHITIRDKKTLHIKSKGYRKIKINNTMQQFFDDYTQGMGDHEFLFQSRKGTNQAISRQRAYEILNECARACGIDEIGTHTMRKSFGYHFYKATKDVAMLQKLFNHSHPSITLRYIGIEQDQMDEALDNFIL